MTDILDWVRRVGWAIVEAGVLVVILCLLLNIILGAEASGPFVASVATNANGFLQSLPAGVALGVVLIILAYGLVTSALKRGE